MLIGGVRVRVQIMAVFGGKFENGMRAKKKVDSEVLTLSFKWKPITRVKMERDSIHDDDEH